MAEVVAKYVSQAEADDEETMQPRYQELEVQALLQEIETKQAVVGRFLANPTGEPFPLDAVQYPKHIADARARLEQLTGEPYTRLRAESFAVGQVLANNPSLDIYTNREPHSLVLEEVVRGKRQAEQDRKLVQALPGVFEQLRNEIEEGVKAVEAGQLDPGAINYYRGLAQQYNQTVEQLQAVAPQLSGHLPQEISVQEITEEMQKGVEQSQEQSQSYSLSV
jgi:hypothetical protein